PTSCPYWAPAAVEIDSLISVPPRSLAPASSRSWASFGPSFTHDDWMFLSASPSIRRASACSFTTSTPVAPGRTPGTSPLAYIGASEWIRESGTNSVNPPVSFWIERSSAMWRIQWSGVSTWPYMIVEVVRMPSAWAVVITSTHWPTVIRPREIRSRISWSRISADVPGRVPSPAARSSARYSLIGSPDVTDLPAAQLVGDEGEGVEVAADRSRQRDAVVDGELVAVEDADEDAANVARRPVEDGGEATSDASVHGTPSRGRRRRRASRRARAPLRPGTPRASRTRDRSRGARGGRSPCPRWRGAAP